MTNQQPTTRDEVTTRALVAVETAERLAVRAAQTIAATPENDLTMVPPSVLNAIAETRALLDALTDVTTTTTCSLVKDQGWSDEISRAASERVRAALERVEREKVNR